MNVYVVQGAEGSEAAHWTWDVAAFLDGSNATLYAQQMNQLVQRYGVELEACQEHHLRILIREAAFENLRKYDQTLENHWDVRFECDYSVLELPLKG